MTERARGDAMSGLAAFLAARLDEDEAVALACMDVNDRVRMRNGTPPPRWTGAEDSGDIRSEDGILRVRHTWVRERDHITRHDPARVLREVEAKRAVLAEHGPANGGRDADRCRVCTAMAHTGMGHADARRFRAPCPTLIFLAAVYSDHPDYRGEWSLTG